MKILISSIVITFALTSLLKVESGELDLRDPNNIVLNADTDHSSIFFRTVHWGIVDIIGWFEEYEVTVNVRNDDWTDADILITLDPSSIRMPNMGMAHNLQRQEFFDSENFPIIEFRSQSIVQAGDSTFTVVGDLKIKTTTRSVGWEMNFNGATYPPKGIPGFTVKGVIVRSEFGLGEVDSGKANDKPLIADSVFVTCSFRMYEEGY